MKTFNRVSGYPNDRDYISFTPHVKVLVDGKETRFVSADEELGLIVREVRNEAGEIQVGGGKILEEVLSGKVEIIWSDPECSLEQWKLFSKLRAERDEQERMADNWQQAKADIEFLTVQDCKIEPFLGSQILNPELFTFDVDMVPVATAKGSYGKHNETGKNEKRDLRLMNFLAEQNHTGPFEHLHFSLFAEMPIFVAREWVRHRTQSYSEISMRYTESPAKRFWIPDQWRDSDDPSGNKQGSGSPLNAEDSAIATDVHRTICTAALMAYRDLLKAGVCKEQARAVLPVGMITQMFASANLLNWFRFVKLRTATNAQQEIRHYGNAVSALLTKQYPRAWDALEASFNKERNRE